MIYRSVFESELLECADFFAKQIQFPSIVFLKGDLGSGKSAFCRCLIQNISNDLNLVVPSPTFTIVQEYETPRGVIFHYDLYRLSHPSELIELNFDESTQTGICLIEWPDIASHISPTWVINIEKESDTTRNISIKKYSK